MKLIKGELLLLRHKFCSPFQRTDLILVGSGISRTASELGFLVSLVLSLENIGVSFQGQSSVQNHFLPWKLVNDEMRPDQTLVPVPEPSASRTGALPLGCG